MRLKQGVLTTGSADKTTRLHAMIAGRPPAGGTLELTAGNHAAYRIEVLPLCRQGLPLPQGGALVVVETAGAKAMRPSQKQLSGRFDLTPAEALLARELLYGDGIPAAAQRLGISRTTARTHLRRLFQKTGTNRQAELVRLVLQQNFAGEAGPTPRGRRGAPAAPAADE